MNLNEYKIIKLLHESKKQLFFRELSKLSKVSIGGTQQVLKDYSKFITKKKEGRNTYYQLNKDLNSFYLKVIIESMKVQEFLVKNPLFKEFVSYLIDNDIPSLIFGSYANRTSDKDSDLDIVLLSSKEIPDHLCPVELHKINLSKSQFQKAVVNKEQLIQEIRKSHVCLNYIDFFVNLLEVNDG